VEVGNRFPLHATAAGKVLLAHQPEERVDRIIEKWGLPKITSNTITDKNELRAELEQIREGGIAVNDEEEVDGLYAMSVPVFKPNETVIGSLSAYGAKNKLSIEEFKNDVPETLRGITNEFNLDLKLE
jgi:DNA-binding IclR family transcriptional regulator